MSGFWSLEGAPKWWFDKRSWAVLSVVAALLLGSRWLDGPQRVAPGQVVFYGAAWCPYSKALREHLDASGIAYVERDIDGSWRDFVRYLWAAGRGGSLPVVQVGPRVVSKGFYREPIDAALRDAGLRPATGPAGPEGESGRR